jgi:hypothetical protein
MSSYLPKIYSLFNIGLHYILKQSHRVWRVEPQVSHWYTYLLSCLLSEYTSTVEFYHTLIPKYGDGEDQFIWRVQRCDGSLQGQ